MRLPAMARRIEQPARSANTAERERYEPLRGEQQVRDRVRVTRVERHAPLERGDAARAELGAGVRPQLGERGGRLEGGAVGARRQHRAERVGDVDDARAERDLLALKAVRIAGAVEPLVVVA